MEDGVLMRLLSVTPQPQPQFNRQHNCSPLKTSSLCDSGYFLRNLMKSQCLHVKGLMWRWWGSGTGTWSCRHIWAESGCSQVDWKQIKQNNKYPDAPLLLHYSFGSLLFCIAQNRRKENNLLFSAQQEGAFWSLTFLLLHFDLSWNAGIQTLPWSSSYNYSYKTWQALFSQRCSVLRH